MSTTYFIANGDRRSLSHKSLYRLCTPHKA